MILLDENFEKIKLGINTKLVENDILTDSVDYQAIVDRKIGPLSRPAINITIDNCTFTKFRLNDRTCKPIITIIVIVKNLRGEGERRFDILKLSLMIIEILDGNNLDLDFLQSDLEATSFLNVTDAEFANAAYMLYELKFSCSFNIVRSKQNEMGVLKQIANSYYLQDPDDGVKDKEGFIDLNVYDGGNAFTTKYTGEIGGGYANSEFKHIIDGGNANTIY